MSKDSSELFDDEVSTGATLASGTTIGGNEVYHLGNDGQGSGLDAEFVQGSVPIFKGKEYTRETDIQTTDTQGDILTQFNPPGYEPTGIGFDSNDCIWFSDDAGTSPSIYRINKSGIATSAKPSKEEYPTGVGVDSNDSVWVSHDLHGYIYEYSVSELQSIGRIEAPAGDAGGLGVDSNDSIWVSDRYEQSIYQIDRSGSVFSQFASPSSSASGVGLDSSDSIWHAENSSDTIYKFNQSGSILTEFATPSSRPAGIGIGSNKHIWHADSYQESIYKIDSGTFVGTKFNQL